MSADEAQSVTKKMQKGAFDFNDFLKQSQSLRAMGGMAGMLKLIPGARLVYLILVILSISSLPVGYPIQAWRARSARSLCSKLSVE